MSEPITVSVADGHLDRIDELVDRLEAGGMHVDQVLNPIGVITGWVDADQLHALGALAGVAAVEPQRTVQLPPPDTDVQ